MPHLNGMADGHAIKALRQLGEKCREIVFLEFLARVALPKDRSELRLQFEDAAREEALDRFARFGEYAPVGREPRSLDRKYEIIGRCARDWAGLA
jgi:hypothetical protein